MSIDSTTESRRASLRLALLTGLLLVVLLAISAATVLYVVGASQQEATTNTLVDVTENVDQPSEAPKGVWVEIVEPNGRRSSSADMPRGFPDERSIIAVSSGAPPITVHTSVNDHNYVVRTAGEHGRTVQAIMDQHENSEELGRVARALLVAGGTAIVLSSLLAIWLARRTMRPMAHALALQRRFVMDASHELRTPLTLLSTRVQLLRRKIAVGSNEDVLKDVDGVIDDSRELTEILDDLLIVADTRVRQPVDVAAIADDVVMRATPHANERGIALQRVGQQSGVMTDGAPVALGRAMVALVDNAIAFAKTRVELRVDSHGDHVEIAVSDDGPGFPPGATNSVFERFASSRESPPERGGRAHYGLGLALVAEVADRHGGTVSLDSVDRVSEGSTGALVSMRLPATGARRRRQ